MCVCFLIMTTFGEWEQNYAGWKLLNIFSVIWATWMKPLSLMMDCLQPSPHLGEVVEFEVPELSWVSCRFQKCWVSPPLSYSFHNKRLCKNCFVKITSGDSSHPFHIMFETCSSRWISQKRSECQFGVISSFLGLFHTRLHHSGG